MVAIPLHYKKLVERFDAFASPETALELMTFFINYPEYLMPVETYYTFRGTCDEALRVELYAMEHVESKPETIWSMQNSVAQNFYALITKYALQNDDVGHVPLKWLRSVLQFYGYPSEMVKALKKTTEFHIQTDDDLTELYFIIADMIELPNTPRNKNAIAKLKQFVAAL